MSDTRTTFGFRFCAAFIVAAVFLFSWNMIARAQDVVDEGDEEFAGGEEVFDAEAVDEEAAVEDESSFAEATEDEGGFFSAIGDALRNVGSAIGDAAGAAADAIGDVVGGALDAIGLGGDEEVATDETADVSDEEPEDEDVPEEGEDTDIEAPATAPKTNSFALRVSIAASDVAEMLRSARGPEPLLYEPRSFEIPDRGLLTLRASQDGPLFCLAFDLSEFSVAAELSDASFEVGGVKGAAEEGGVNTVCVGLPALSEKAPLAIETFFK